MKTVAEVIGVSRSNLAERRQGHPQKRIGRPPLPDEELVAQIRAVIAELPTYGYRHVHAILKRQALAVGLEPPNHKRALANRRAAPSRRRSPTPSSARPARVSAACRSRPATRNRRYRSAFPLPASGEKE